MPRKPIVVKSYRASDLEPGDVVGIGERTGTEWRAVESIGRHGDKGHAALKEGEVRIHFADGTTKNLAALRPVSVQVEAS